MYAGRVACYALLSYVEYALRAVLPLKRHRPPYCKVRKKMGQTDGRQDGRQTCALHLALDTAMA